MSLEFRHIAHSYGKVPALHDVSFSAAAGEITCLLGASGCGKSTLLNLAAGLLPVQQGSVHLSGNLLAQAGTNPPPEARSIGLVFQEGALFPHMTIAKNIGFGLSAEEQHLVDGWLDAVGLTELGGRYPHELSGGQRQRAALARAMAPGPDVLLMDEPFASVDIVLRRRLRRDCRVLLRERGTTTILVTHDPEEALDIADRIAVMDAGRIIQFGSPQDLRERPEAASVGAIFGGAQIVAAKRAGEGLETAFGNWPVECLSHDLPDGERFDLLVSASQLSVIPDAHGLVLRDRLPAKVGERLVLVGRGSEEIVMEGLIPDEQADRYRVVPQAKSVRAFSC